MTTYHKVLAEKFEQKKLTNASYSLRAFARDLEISPSKLSQIFNRKQGLSLKCAETICLKLNLEDKEKSWFCLSVCALHARSRKEREACQDKMSSTLL